jgi:hypothetical protein
MNHENERGSGETRRQRRPWSPPRVILSKLQSTHHQVGQTPADKINFALDQVTPSGSSGS